MSTIRLHQVHTTDEAADRDIERALPAQGGRVSAFAAAPANLLLAAAAVCTLLLLFLGDAQSSTSLIILLAALAARFAGFSAVLVLVPLALLPAHWLARGELQWIALSTDVLVALSVAALVNNLSKRNREQQRETHDLRVGQREVQKLVTLLHERLGHTRHMLRHVGRARALRSTRQSRLLADATFELLSDCNYATVYARIARMAALTLGDACRVDLWDPEARQVERSWTAAQENAQDQELFLKQIENFEQLPQIRNALRFKRTTALEPVAGLNWPRSAGPHNQSRQPANLVIVPVVIGGVVRVTLTIARRHDAPACDSGLLALADDFARHCAVVITHLFRLEHLLAARYRAEDAEQAKTEVLAAFSHDMRTPLQAVNGYTQLLLEQLAGPLNAKQREYLLRIQQAQERVAGFVDRVLALARLDNQQSFMDTRPVELSALTRDVVALFALDCQAKNLRVDVPRNDERLILRADAEKLSRVLQNLISNAVKYTAPGGIITVSWRELGNRIEVVVSDNGRGVPKQELDNIFRPFYQVDPQSEGSGLGLAISRSLAHDMGGDLQVASELGRGSTFTLHLPRAIAIHTTVDPVMLEPLVLPVLASRQSA